MCLPVTVCIEAIAVEPCAPAEVIGYAMIV